jgi:hypothetical protein
LMCRGKPTTATPPCALPMGRGGERVATTLATAPRGQGSSPSRKKATHFFSASGMKPGVFCIFPCWRQICCASRALSASRWIPRATCYAT